MKDLLTTVLDAAGALLIVAGLAVLAAELEVTALVRGLVVAGAGALIVSWVADGAPLPKRKGRS